VNVLLIRIPQCCRRAGDRGALLCGYGGLDGAARDRLCSTSDPALVCGDVADPSVEPVVLPVGFEKFHRRGFLNYQFNRAHGLGWADGHELRDAAARTRSTGDCVAVFEDLSAQAAADGRLRHAVGYLRLAEFFTPPRSAAKVERYRRFRALFDAFSGGGLIRHAIPYAGASLPAYWLPAAGERLSGGAVLIHGGFDSLIEEFYPIWQRIAMAGFDVVAFEGPGQGGARALSGLTFDHDWERPVGAVLDYFGLASAGLVGISMGGYWAVRAAGREPRINRVVAWPPVFDWLYRLPMVMRGPVRTMLRRRRLMRWSVRARARLIPTLRQIVDHTLYLVDGHDPLEVVQPPSLTRAHAKALTAARSVTVRMFTKSEDADQHCQIGNIGLACRVLTTWLRNTSPEPTGLG
jgi:pimeloyl-ACP methyl ester carboxylesterase